MHNLNSDEQKTWLWTHKHDDQSNFSLKWHAKRSEMAILVGQTWSQSSTEMDNRFHFQTKAHHNKILPSRYPLVEIQNFLSKGNPTEFYLALIAWIKGYSFLFYINLTSMQQKADPQEQPRKHKTVNPNSKAIGRISKQTTSPQKRKKVK